VPAPASSPLLFVYPVGWLIGAVVWFAAASHARDEDSYRSAVQAICKEATTAGADMSAGEMIPQVEDERTARRARAAGVPVCGAPGTP
jgi:hypothetical protein